MVQIVQRSVSGEVKWGPGHIRGCAVPLLSGALHGRAGTGWGPFSPPGQSSCVEKHKASRNRLRITCP